MDYYSASGMSMLFLVFFQTISIAWIFGTTRFCDCIEQMSGHRPSWFFYICWSFFGPLVMAVRPLFSFNLKFFLLGKSFFHTCLKIFLQGVFLFYAIQYIPVTYGENYQYPWWAEVIGIIISLSSMLWIPGYAAYYIMTTPGTIREVCLFSFFFFSYVMMLDVC